MGGVHFLALFRGGLFAPREWMSAIFSVFFRSWVFVLFFVLHLFDTFAFANDFIAIFGIFFSTVTGRIFLSKVAGNFFFNFNLQQGLILQMLQLWMKACRRVVSHFSGHPVLQKQVFLNPTAAYLLHIFFSFEYTTRFFRSNYK